MKIEKNYKIAVSLIIFTVVISKFIFPFCPREIPIVMFSLAVLCVIFKPIGNFLYDFFSKVGKFIGNWISRIILLFVWIFAVMPTGVLMKITKRDRLKLKKTQVESYWVNNKEQEKNYEYQF